MGNHAAPDDQQHVEPKETMTTEPSLEKESPAASPARNTFARDLGIAVISMFVLLAVAVFSLTAAQNSPKAQAADASMNAAVTLVLETPAEELTEMSFEELSELKAQTMKARGLLAKSDSSLSKLANLKIKEAIETKAGQ